MGSPPYRVKAVFDYKSPHEDDLSFSLGQIITVTDEEDVDWYYGEYDHEGVKKQGLFPRNFVEMYEPTTPPRPSRPARAKKEVEATPTQQEPALPKEFVESAPATDQPKPSHVGAPLEALAQAAGLGIAGAPADSEDDQPDPSVEEATPARTAARTEPREPPEKKPANVASLRSPAGPQSTQQSIGGSFKDRIAAFNKPAAPPVAPQKPGNLSQAGSAGFVKKPYVAPPPSRNAYVPPPKDNPYAPQKRAPEAESAGPSQASVEPLSANTQEEVAAADTGEEQPKPTKLKDRIALLQKQQLEQAARHAEAAQKKEKPKKPPKKTTSQHSETLSPPPAGEEEHVDDTLSQDDAGGPRAPPKPARRKSKIEDAQDTGAGAVPREFLSDTNDADQSAGGDTEEGGDLTMTHVDSHARRREDEPVLASPDPSIKEALQEQVEGESEEAAIPEGSDQEEDIDPEIKRRMEIRERMAKMSGGMGMAGMFGPPGGMPGMASKKPKQTSAGGAEPINEGPNTDPDNESRQPVPIMALPGMSFPSRQKVQSPEVEEEVSSQSPPANIPPSPEEPGSVEGSDYSEAEKVAEVGSPDQGADVQEKSSKPLSDRPVPVPPVLSHSGAQSARSEPGRGAPPPPPGTSRPVPAPPVPTARPPPPIPGLEQARPSVPEQDDRDDDPDDFSTRRRVPPVPPPAAPATRPAKPQGPRSPRTSDAGSSFASPDPQTPLSPGTSKQLGRVPPVPGPFSSPSSPPQNRAPPPPPPSQAPPSRRSTDLRESTGADRPKYAEGEEEITEYEGDYDTDIASGAPRKEALKARDRSSSADDTLAGDDPSLHHAGLPSIGPSAAPPPVPSSAAPRTVPPPLPPQPSKRQSSDMPRAAPPPPPPKQEPLSFGKEMDQSIYASPPLAPFSPEHDLARTLSPTSRKSEGSYAQPSLAEAHGTEEPSVEQHQMQPSGMSTQGPPRRSLEAPPPVGASRRSTEATFAPGEQGYFAQDLDLGRPSQWWMQRKAPPPIFQNRNDIYFEIEESAAPGLTVKHVYVLFADYSQSIITARFEEANPPQAELSQRHDAPPTRLRQDQLEEAHSRFGARLANMAAAKANSVVGSGTAFALISELLSAFPDALPPVGTRAYGSLIYTNMANASVQQHDEIRAGDVVTFRNAKMQGHKGGLKQKYSMDVGKPDHVGVVVDWDGTKKKVRAWEQGRESRKVKVESFKLGDLRSGEVRIWRIVARDWVGWGR